MPAWTRVVKIDDVLSALATPDTTTTTPDERAKVIEEARRRAVHERFYR